MEEDYEILTDVAIVGRVEEIQEVIDGFMPNVPEYMRSLIKNPSYDRGTELIAFGHLYGRRDSIDDDMLSGIKAVRDKLRDYGTIDALRNLLELDPAMWVSFDRYTRWKQ